MIIFGWGRRTVKKYGPIGVYLCPNCHNNSVFLLVKVTRWFTLFFIPLIPYSPEYLLLCSICSKGSRLDRDQFAQYRAIVQQDAGAQGGPPAQVVQPVSPEASSPSPQEWR
jgi:hypothetical protein